MAYLDTNAFNFILGFLSSQFSPICSLITLPEQSMEQRTIQGIRIGKPGTQTKRTVLLFGGCHARELVNPDLLLQFAFKLMTAFNTNTDLVFGSVVYATSTVQLIVQSIDVIIVPLINPDGRAYVQSTDPWWRKNRNPNGGATCAGVDINRNYDFLWSSGIGTSTNLCSETYKGTAPFSEPETRNVRSLLDTYPEIEAMVDVHSYSELVLYPWGDDETQTTDPNMNFMNPAFNGQRGTGGDVYKEYMKPDDEAFFEDVGFRVRDAIHAVRGRCYTVKTGFGLYPTSGTSKDYAYSRHIVDSSKRKIFAYTFETGQEFQPPAAEASQIMTEVGAGLFEFCLAICCPILSKKQHQPYCSVAPSTIDLFHSPLVTKTRMGKRYESLLTTHFMEVRELMETNQSIYRAVVRLIRSTDQVARLHFADSPGTIDERLIQNIERALSNLSRAKGIGVEIKETMDSVRKDLPHFKGKTFVEGLKSADREELKRKKP
jgi:murein tripeptide amidase MpaA